MRPIRRLVSSVRSPLDASQAVLLSCQSAFQSAQFGSTPPPQFEPSTTAPTGVINRTHSTCSYKNNFKREKHTFLPVRSGHLPNSPSSRKKCCPQKKRLLLRASDLKGATHNTDEIYKLSTPVYPSPLDTLPAFFREIFYTCTH